MEKNISKKVFIVDDDPFILDMYVRKFTAAGFVLETATDGNGALEGVKKSQPDIVLLDIIMPQADGFEVLQKLKENAITKKIPVVLLTNLGQKGDIEKGLQLGAVDYIVKAHFTPSEVVEKIKNILKI
ncbi:MAG: response regulator [Patescibacteria group bacterium]